MAKTDTAEATRRVIADGGKTSPCLLNAQAQPATLQQARVARLLRLLREAKASGQATTAVRIADLEALICIAAITDAGVAQ